MDSQRPRIARARQAHPLGGLIVERRADGHRRGERHRSVNAEVSAPLEVGCHDERHAAGLGGYRLEVAKQRGARVDLRAEQNHATRREIAHQPFELLSSLVVRRVVLAERPQHQDLPDPLLEAHGGERLLHPRSLFGRQRTARVELPTRLDLGRHRGRCQRSRRANTAEHHGNDEQQRGSSDEGAHG